MQQTKEEIFIVKCKNNMGGASGLDTGSLTSG
jgi:hypothetical protein